MRRGDVRGAVEAARRLGDALHRDPASGLDGLRDAYFSLLDQRGYFVNSAEQIATSVREIREVGPGFDLYELSDALAACDVAATDCRGLSLRRKWPELAPFSRPCRCGGARPEEEMPHGP